MNLMDKFKDLARREAKRIVLPEGEEERTIRASEIIKNQNLAHVILLGNEEVIKEKAKKLEVDISNIEIVNPLESSNRDFYAKEFYELRKNKGVTFEDAMEIVKTPMYYGIMMVKLGDGDGLVSGAVHTTGELLKPALQVIKTAPGINVVSSFFMMLVPDCEYGDEGLLLFADSAVNPNPTAEQLASIAICTADNGKKLCNMEPKVAMLSFSTMGSAEHELVDKVREAVKIANKLRPDLQIEGELQLDAAIVPSVGKQKAPNSKVAGNANILIFPDLQAGNIGYKLVQRFAKAEAIGPVCQGFNSPVNDLSRGCSVDDIVNVVTLTAIQAQN